MKIYGYECICLYGLIDTWIYGYINIWIYGYMDIWIYFIWVYRYIDIFGHRKTWSTQYNWYGDTKCDRLSDSVSDWHSWYKRCYASKKLNRPIPQVILQEPTSVHKRPPDQGNGPFRVSTTLTNHYHVHKYFYLLQPYFRWSFI